jgi:heat shock protein HslJ
MKKYLLILLTLSLAFSACSARDSSASLIGSWKLTAYGSADSLTPVVPNSQAQITFSEDGTVNGNSGCNGFGGSYAVQGDQLTFSEIVSTLMLCDTPLMGQEEAVFQVIIATAAFQVESDTLTLTNNNRVLVLTR